MKNKWILPILSALCVLSIVGMILALFGGKKNEALFTPPPFDSTAQQGFPEPEEKSFTKLYQDGMGYTSYLCGNVRLKEHHADVYFTNVAENTVWMKLRILDADGTILGETGIIQPGEYVQSVAFEKAPKSGQEIKLKIMAYEPDTYYSAGAVVLNTTVGEG